MPLYPTSFSYNWNAPDRTYLGESFPIQASSVFAAPATAGRLELARIKVPVPGSCTNVVLNLQAAGASLTAGQCFCALYTAAGVLVGQSSDQAAAWAGTGLKAAALAGGPFTLAAGEYYGVMWFNGTTGPTLMRQAGVSAGITNAGRSAPNFIACVADTSITTTAPGTLGVQTSASSLWYMGLN